MFQPSLTPNMKTGQEEQDLKYKQQVYSLGELGVEFLLFFFFKEPVELVKNYVLN